MQKKHISFLAVALFSLSACSTRTEIKYSDDTPIRINLTTPSLKIVQFSDIHLNYGFDKSDHLTFELIKNVTNEVKPDLIVFTGDQTLSITSVARYKDLTNFMDEIKTPWTFVFGNHDNDYTTKAKILKGVFSLEPEYLYFKEGPELDKDGVGNFSFNYFYNDQPFYNLYFLDSKDELKRKETDSLSKYKYLSAEQVDWYSQKAGEDKTSNVYSSLFMHIPLVQFSLSLDFENVSIQSKDTGLFNSILTHGVTQAVFVGHNHTTDSVFTHQGIKLVHGRLSGFNASGTIARGARIIEITPTSGTEPLLTTSIIYEDLTYAI